MKRFHPEGVYPIIEEFAQRLGRPATETEILALGYGVAGSAAVEGLPQPAAYALYCGGRQVALRETMEELEEAYQRCEVCEIVALFRPPGLKP